MRRQQSLIRYFNIYSFTLIITTAAIASVVWVLLEAREFQSNLVKEQQSLIENKRDEIKTIVDDAGVFIHTERKKWETELNTLLIQRVEEVISLAENIYETYTGEFSDDEILNTIIEALRPIRFNYGRGYYFMVDLGGTELLYPVAPEFEGQNLLDLQDSKGTYVIRKEIEVIEKHGEGFVRDFWTKPGASVPSEKLTYIKAFHPLDIYIGTGEYLEDFEKDVQNRIADTLSQIRVDTDEYIFGGTWEGVTVMGPATGKNNWDIQDSDGNYVVRELVEAAKTGSGFVSYRIPEGIGKPVIKKTSYVIGVPDWEWYVGAGFDESKIIQRIDQRRSELTRKFQLRITLIGILFIALLLINYFLLRIFSRKISYNYRQFQDFFDKAETGMEPIDKKNLSFREFLSLADSANRMISLNQAAKKEIKTRLEEKETLLKEIHHRVKNNLQIISSLLNLQQETIESERDRKSFQESIDRIRVMAIIHEQLYESENLSNLDMRSFFEQMLHHLLTVYNNPRGTPEINYAIPDISLEIDKAIPLGIIVNELITNCLKYAGTGDSTPIIDVHVEAGEDSLDITVADNGRGVSSDFKPELSGTLGLKLVYSLVAQLGARIEWESRHGLRWFIQIPA